VQPVTASGSKKMFFFEKKNQKTFLRWGAPRGRVSDTASGMTAGTPP
jgi:hypothetical protein